LREQGAELQATASEVLERVQRQTSRVDSMVTSVVDGVEHASNTVADTVSRPLRQLNAALASAKAFFSVLATGRRPSRPANATADQDMFV
jgi:gamma-glutamyl:cysteine ligase YbdK (ATP-grasp superfamily)